MSLAAALLSQVLAGGPVLASPPEGPAVPPELGSGPRGNDSLSHRRRKPVYSVGAAARFGVLLGNGRDIVQPLGFGFAAQIRAHFINLAAVRFGIGFAAGHTRFPERRSVEGVDEFTGEFVTKQRWARISHTDLSLGPSFGIPLGPVIVSGEVTAGLGIDQLYEPNTPFASLMDREITSYDPLVRGALDVGIPIRNDHGISVGVGVHKYFSDARYKGEPIEGAEAEAFAPFDLMLETYLAYTAWF